MISPHLAWSQVEEYVTAKHAWGLSQTDLSEIARNSVNMSSAARGAADEPRLFATCGSVCGSGDHLVRLGGAARAPHRRSRPVRPSASHALCLIRTASHALFLIRTTSHALPHTRCLTHTASHALPHTHRLTRAVSHALPRVPMHSVHTQSLTRAALRVVQVRPLQRAAPALRLPPLAGDLTTRQSLLNHYLTIT